MSQSDKHQHIKRRSWGRFYVAPVLLDHRSYKRLLLAVIVLGVGSFFGGYIFGFEKAGNILKADKSSMSMELPKADIQDLALIEAQVPDRDEPGASIDVDSVDLEDTTQIIVEEAVAKVETKLASLATDIEKPSSIDEKPVETSPLPATKIEIPQVENNQAEPLDDTIKENIKPVNSEVAESLVKSDLESAQSEPDVDDSHQTQPESGIEVLATQTIVDDTSEATARYSIQVGMYSSFDNAANKVEQLLNTNLSAYIHDYKNNNNETRYNVRFGYFASLSNARLALKIFEQNYAGSGYIARVNQ